MKTETAAWAALMASVREPLAVYATPSSGGMYNVRVSLRQRVPGDAKNAIAAIFGSHAEAKHVFAFDPDIDVFSDAETDWAFATRFQADRDLLVGSGFRVVPLDPSLGGARTGAKLGFDCTIPFGKANSLEFSVPTPPVAKKGAQHKSVEDSSCGRTGELFGIDGGARQQGRPRDRARARCALCREKSRPARRRPLCAQEELSAPDTRARIKTKRVGRSFMQRTTPPFRADHVGSLLRPPVLKEARAKRERGEITADALRAIEDREIEKVIKKQEEIGLKLATDGELRRSWWHFDFFRGLDGVTFYTTDAIQFHGVQTKAEGIKIDGKLGFSGHPMLEHFKFLKAHTRVTPKMTIPAPSTFHFRQGRAAISKEVYPDLDPFFDDLAKAYRNAIRAFYDAGCRYLQLDDTAWSMMCDPNERAQSTKRGDNPDALPKRYARLTNAALEGKPADMAITMHSCRGNFRSTFIASGGYEFVAEQLLGNTGLDGYFLEYDTDRAGGFEPLRFFPKGKKQVVLGLVTSKFGKLENKDDIKRRIDEATKYIALDQLCLSPQCGFASTEEGNVLAEDEQWAKLRMIVELADEVWG